jgi:hypothetical protein
MPSSHTGVKRKTEVNVQDHEGTKRAIKRVLFLPSSYNAKHVMDSGRVRGTASRACQSRRISSTRSRSAPPAPFLSDSDPLAAFMHILGRYRNALGSKDPNAPQTAQQQWTLAGLRKLPPRYSHPILHLPAARCNLADHRPKDFLSRRCQVTRFPTISISHRGSR